MMFTQKSYTKYNGGGKNNNGYMSYRSDLEEDRGFSSKGSFNNNYQRNSYGGGGYGGGEDGGGFDLPRFHHKGAPVRPKAMPFTNEEQRQMLTVEIAPAQWRKENNMYMIKRMGYILFSFFEISEDMRVDGSSKRTFVVTAKNMDVLLDLDTSSSYDDKQANEELLLYKPMNSPVMNIMKVSKTEGRNFLFSYCEMADGGDGDENIQSYNEITLKPGQVKMIQTLCEFGLPALSGMHAIYNPSLID